MIARVLLFISLFFATSAAALAQERPEHFLYAGPVDLSELASLIEREDIDGVQIIYNWRMLERGPGEYDFSAIERDLAFLSGRDKKLFVQLQDRFFSNQARRLPEYLLTDPAYGGGLTPQIDNPGEGEPVQQGWVAIQWNDALRGRYQALLAALAEQFDGRIYGINLPESAVGIDEATDETGFSCDTYFDVTMENILFAREAFETSHVVQYVNFWPCEWNNDHGFMGRIFDTAVEAGFGLGGPDIIPYRRGQMKNSYPFFNRYKDDLSLIAMAVQEPTLTYTNPDTGETFTREEFVDFATNYLGVDIIFWTTQAPWWAQD